MKVEPNQCLRGLQNLKYFLQIYFELLDLLGIKGIITSKSRVLNVGGGIDLFAGCDAAEMLVIDKELDRQAGIRQHFDAFFSERQNYSDVIPEKFRLTKEQ